MNLTLASILLNLGLGSYELILILVILCISILPLIFYLLTLQNTLEKISVENRKMNPGEVWLSLIPVFGFIWQFFIVMKMADSLKAEFAKLNIPIIEDKPGYSIGLAYCILFCCGVIPFLGILSSIGGLVCWIIYWIKINDFKAMLLKNPIK